MREKVKLFTKYGICPKCFTIKKLTAHHCYPKRFFGSNDSRLYLCRCCHDIIEKRLPKNRQLTKEEYIDIHKAWLKGGTILIA